MLRQSRFLPHEGAIFGHTAEIHRLIETARLQNAIAEILKRAPDPTAFDENRQPFPFACKASNNKLDAYFTRMHDSSLKNYQANAQAGVSFQNSHRSRELPLGQSFAAAIEVTKNGLKNETGSDSGTEDLIELLVDVYTVPGLKLNEVATDDFILGLRTAIIRDVSIGFYGGMFRCSICALDLWDWDCSHIPGFQYAVTDKQGKASGAERLCFAWVENASLAEISAVYDGATPGAAIIKANMEAEAGRIAPEKASIIESRYRIHLPEKRVTVPVNQGERSMAKENENNPAPGTQQPGTETTETTQRATEQPATVATAPAQPQTVEFRALLLRVLEAAETVAPEACKGFRALATEEGVKTLVALATDGRMYRTDLIEEALKEGVRACGSEFQQETYRAVLNSSSLDVIKRMRDDWRKIAGGELKPGRQTEDAERASETESSAVKDDAFTPATAFF